MLVLIILAEKTLDVAFMRDPDLLFNSRFLSKEEVEEAGVVNLSKHRMNVGFVIYDRKEEIYKLLPEEFATEFRGRFEKTVADPEPSSSCKGLFADVDEQNEDL